LDDCREEDVSKENAEASVDLTTKWAERAKNHLEKEYPGYLKSHKLFAVVQGGGYKDLREQSAKQLQDIGFDGYCFGGWPVDDKGNLVSDILKYTEHLLPDDKPKYAMGVGSPDDIKKCWEMGYNIFDCVIPTRNARHGLLYTSKGPVKIKNSKYKFDMSSVDERCNCELCRNYSKGYLHHLFKSGEMSGMTLATMHNLTYYQDLMKSLSSL
jgi:queuine tRNA-ribosyltransferase